MKLDALAKLTLLIAASDLSNEDIRHAIFQLGQRDIVDDVVAVRRAAMQKSSAAAELTNENPRSNESLRSNDRVEILSAIHKSLIVDAKLPTRDAAGVLLKSLRRRGVKVPKLSEPRQKESFARWIFRLSKELSEDDLMFAYREGLRIADSLGPNSNAAWKLS